MDHVYGAYNKHASSKVSIKEYFQEYAKTINDADCFTPSTKDDKNIVEMMGVDLEEEEISMLSQYCSVDKLTVEGELGKIVNNRKMRRKDVFDPEDPKDANLQTIQNLKRRIKDENRKPSYKYQSELFINYNIGKPDGEVAEPGKDCLIFFRIYSPFIHRTRPKTHFGSKLLLQNVMAMVGSQTLADLKDKISCVSDYTISRESSNNPDNAVGPMAKHVYKSGFFYIEDTFYNDTRDPLNKDYSEVILKWALHRSKFKSKLGPFQKATMEDCRLDSLCVRFGFPWVYKHQGGCEHLILFSDARLVNCDDELSVDAYPRIVRLRPRSSKLCMICGTYCARWITMDHERIPHSPCMFCDSCFRSYNYVDDKKVGNFRLYAYPRNNEYMKISNSE